MARNITRYLFPQIIRIYLVFVWCLCYTIISLGSEYAVASQFWFGLMANNGLCVMVCSVMLHLFVVVHRFVVFCCLSDNVLTVTIRDIRFDKLSVIG